MFLSLVGRHVAFPSLMLADLGSLVFACCMFVQLSNVWPLCCVGFPCDRRAFASSREAL